MLKSAEEIRKMIDEREYAVNSIAVEDSIYWMVKNRGTYTFAVIKSHRLIDELKNLGAKEGDIVSILDQEFEYEEKLY